MRARGAHTDFGSLTILAFNDAPGGLQVMMPDASWQDVVAGPGQPVVNLGRMMQRWTNDRWKSTPHRVVNSPAHRRGESRRQSIGSFLHPNHDAEIACIETCCGDDRPARYPPIRAGDHMREKWSAGRDARGRPQSGPERANRSGERGRSSFGGAGGRHGQGEALEPVRLIPGSELMRTMDVP